VNAAAIGDAGQISKIAPNSLELEWRSIACEKSQFPAIHILLTLSGRKDLGMNGVVTFRQYLRGKLHHIRQTPMAHPMFEKQKEIFADDLRDGIASQNKLIAFVYDQLWALRKATRSKAAQTLIAEGLDKIENWPQRRAV
jgi:hypothetical protein